MQRYLVFVVWVTSLLLFAHVNTSQVTSTVCEPCAHDHSCGSDECQKKIANCMAAVESGEIHDADQVAGIIPSYLTFDEYRYFSDLIDLVISKEMSHSSSFIDLRAQQTMQGYDYPSARTNCRMFKDQRFFKNSRVEDLLDCAVILLKTNNSDEAFEIVKIAEKKEPSSKDIRGMLLFIDLYPYLEEKKKYEIWPELSSSYEENECDQHFYTNSVLYNCACGLYASLCSISDIPTTFAQRVVMLTEGKPFPSFSAEACGRLLMKVGMWYDAIEKDFNLKNLTASTNITQSEFFSLGVANKLAKIAYSQDRTWEQAQELTRYGFKIAHFRREQSQETAGIVISMGGQVLIAYHGSESCEDWCTDLRLWSVSGNGYGLIDGRVHAGFSDYVKQSWDSLRNALFHGRTTYSAFNPPKIVVIGHSLGGAQAILGSLLLYDFFSDFKPTIYVITFGSPRVMSSTAVTAFPKENIRVIRGHNVVDPAPRFPPYIPWILDYEHVGEEHLIDTFALNPHGLIQWESVFDLSSPLPLGRLLLLILWALIPTIRDLISLSRYKNAKEVQYACQGVAILECMLFLVLTWNCYWMTWILYVAITMQKLEGARKNFPVDLKKEVTLEHVKKYASNRFLAPVLAGVFMLTDWYWSGLYIQIDNHQGDFLFALFAEVVFSFAMILVSLPLKTNKTLYDKKIQANPYIIGFLLLLLAYTHPIVSAFAALIAFYKMFESIRVWLLSSAIVILIWPEWVICQGGRWFGALFTLCVVWMLSPYHQPQQH